MRMGEEIGRGKESDAGGNRRREEIGDGCLAAAGRFISGARLGKKATKRDKGSRCGRNARLGKKANNTWRAEKLCYIRLL